MLLLAINDMNTLVLTMSYIGCVLFTFLLLLFIALHMWWTKKCAQKITIADVGGVSLFRFLKVNIFAFFAAIWGCGLFSAIMALFALR